MDSRRDAAPGWVLLSYRVPREPSSPRIAIWRKLKRLGVAQISDGLVALPADARTREALEWIATEVAEAGGHATVWLGAPASAADEQDLADGMSQARAAEYREVIAEAEEAAGSDDAVRSAVLRRLRAELHRIGRRDFFPTAERDAAHTAVEALGEQSSKTAKPKTAAAATGRRRTS